MDGLGGRTRRYLFILIALLAGAMPAARAADVSPATQSAEATYYVIPIKDGVERGIAELFSKALEAARGAKATHVLLVLDTPGGLVDEMNTMLELMAAAPEFRFVALVHNAGSAGAILAMSCPDVVITPSGAMGAAAMVGLPDDERMRMKLESYNLAKVRAAVEAARHDVMIARGMMEPGLELVAITRDGQRRIVDPSEVQKNAKARGKRAKLPDGARMNTLKNKGTLISLAPEEAVELGVARGILQTAQRPRSSDVGFPLDEVAPLIGLPAWRQVGSAEPMMRKFRAAVAREQHLADHKQELDDIDARLRSLQQEASSIETQIATERANIESLPNSARAGSYTRISSLQNQLRPIADEISALNKRRKAILSGPPKPR